jgi:DNA-directed RNA polymerase subunit beta'
MNRIRVAASGRDAALRAATRRMQDALAAANVAASAAAAEEREASIVAANSAAEEREAERHRDPLDDLGDSPLGAVEGETHGTDEDAGDYLIKGDDAPAGDEAATDEADTAE